MGSTADQDILLREATAKKGAGDINGAIDILRKAYHEISNGETIYPVSTFLRLPLYLQEAGRNDEAWREFNRLLTRGYPKQGANPEIIPMDWSVIYDKMRLFLQREGKNDLAVRFGILSHLSWAIGLHRQGRKPELKQHISKEAIEGATTKLLTKANKVDRLAEVVTVIQKQIDCMPEVDFSELAEAIDGILGS